MYIYVHTHTNTYMYVHIYRFYLYLYVYLHAIMVLENLIKSRRSVLYSFRLLHSFISGLTFEAERERQRAAVYFSLAVALSLDLSRDLSRSCLAHISHARSLSLARDEMWQPVAALCNDQIYSTCHSMYAIRVAYTSSPSNHTGCSKTTLNVTIEMWHCCRYTLNIPSRSLTFSRHIA